MNLHGEPESYVICRLCGKGFRRITWLHLVRYHNTSPSCYKRNFPDAPMESTKFRHKVSRAVVQLWTDKDYAENIRQKLRTSPTKKQRSRIGYYAMVAKYGVETVTKRGTEALLKYNSAHPPALRLRRLHKYGGKTFRSKEEIECYKFLKSLKVAFIYEYAVGQRLIDFFVEARLFWEHHPKNGLDELDFPEYKNQRRQILDAYGYKEYPLIVTQSLKELPLVENAIAASMPHGIR